MRDPLWLARVISLVLHHSIENRSNISISVLLLPPRTDTFHRNAKFVGHLKAIKVYHDRWGIFPHWHLARVSLHMVQLTFFCIWTLQKPRHYNLQLGCDLLRSGPFEFGREWRWEDFKNKCPARGSQWGLTVNRQIAKKLTVNRQKRNILPSTVKWASQN